MEVLIRKATWKDYAGCTKLVMEVHALHVLNAPWLFRMPADGRLWSEVEFAGMVEGPDSAVMLAEAGGTSVGFAHIQIGRSPDLPMFVPRVWCSIDSIGVTETWQKQGVGRKLMEAVERWAVDKGANELSLSVHDFNQQAVKFYRRLGYEDYLHRMRLPIRP